jgi:putative transposase
MVTHRRKPLLIEHIDLLRDAFALSKKKYDYKIEAVVILPEHLHMIIRPKISKEYPKIISHIKINPVKHGYVKDVKDWKYSSFA